MSHHKNTTVLIAMIAISIVLGFTSWVMLQGIQNNNPEQYVSYMKAYTFIPVVAVLSLYFGIYTSRLVEESLKDNPNNPQFWAKVYRKSQKSVFWGLIVFIISIPVLVATILLTLYIFAITPFHPIISFSLTTFIGISAGSGLLALTAYSAKFHKNKGKVKVSE